MHLLWWFTVQVLTSVLVSDLSNVAGHVSAEACTQVQLLYVMNPPIWDWKKILLCENIAICLVLHFLMSCKMAPLVVLHPLYPVCMKIRQRHITAIGMEMSQIVQSSNRYCFNSNSNLLIPKSYATSSQNQVIAHRAKKLQSFTTTDPEFFKCNTKLWA